MGLDLKEDQILIDIAKPKDMAKTYEYSLEGLARVDFKQYVCPCGCTQFLVYGGESLYLTMVECVLCHAKSVVHDG